MPDESFNPYAAPTTTTTQPPEPVRSGHVRMSEASLHTAIRLMVISEVAFAVGWFNFRFPIVDIIVTLGTVGGFLTAWLFISVLMIHCRGVGMLLIALVVPLPLLGSLAFLTCIIHIRQKLILNGYTPRFLGAKPDKTERALMEENLYYAPSLAFDTQGEKRSLSSSLTQILLALVALGFIALIGLG